MGALLITPTEDQFENPDIIDPLEQKVFKQKMKELYSHGQLGKLRGESQVNEGDNNKFCFYPDCNWSQHANHNRRNGLKRHIESVHLNIKYRCPFPGCQQAFTNKTHAKRHFFNTHKERRKYECDICGKKFKTTGVLKDHKMTHTGERPWKCPRCGKGFIQRSPWRLHCVKVCGVHPDVLETIAPDLSNK